MSQKTAVNICTRLYGRTAKLLVILIFAALFLTPKAYASRAALNPSTDFTYQGCFQVPASSWGYGMAVRYVNTTTHANCASTSASCQAQLILTDGVGSPQPIVEVVVPSSLYATTGFSANLNSAPMAATYKSWGSPVSGNGGSFSLFWDNQDSRLYYSWIGGGGPDYQQQGVEPQIGYLTLNDSTGVMTNYGNGSGDGGWGFNAKSMKMFDGGMINVPADFVNTYLASHYPGCSCSGSPLACNDSCPRIGAGFGGYRSNMSVGPCSMGPALLAFVPPVQGTAGTGNCGSGGSNCLSGTTLLAYPYTTNFWTSGSSPSAGQWRPYRPDTVINTAPPDNYQEDQCSGNNAMMGYSFGCRGGTNQYIYQGNAVTSATYSRYPVVGNTTTTLTKSPSANNSMWAGTDGVLQNGVWIQTASKEGLVFLLNFYSGLNRYSCYDTCHQYADSIDNAWLIYSRDALAAVAQGNSTGLSISSCPSSGPFTTACYTESSSSIGSDGVQPARYLVYAGSSYGLPGLPYPLPPCSDNGNTQPCATPNSYLGTSTSSITYNSNATSYTLTVQAADGVSSLAYTVGHHVIVFVNDGTFDSYFEGQITAYNRSTGVMTVGSATNGLITNSFSGTHSSWFVTGRQIGQIPAPGSMSPPNSNNGGVTALAYDPVNQNLYVLSNFTITTGSVVYVYHVNDTVASQYTITASAGSNGSISPSGAVSVNGGTSQTLTVSPSSGYAASVGGTCGGTLSGNTYTTNAITADCTVTATFSQAPQYTITASAGANGTISPAGSVSVTGGSAQQFTVSPNSGYTASVGGTCGGTLSGTTYTTSPVTASCTVTANFSQTTGRTYTTNFPLTENPISENGNWIDGGTVGLDWSNVSTTPGLAIGHESGTVNYTDATALLTGSWGPNQSVQGTVFVGTTYSGDYPEVELRLRSSLSAHNCSGYEISFSADPTSQASNGYLIIVRWNGSVGNFTYLAQYSGAQYNVSNGDTVIATIIGNTINAYKNGVLMGTATDSTYSSGSPGFGLNFGQCAATCQGTNSGYGYTSFTATDSSSSTLLPPTGLRLLGN